MVVTLVGTIVALETAVLVKEVITLSKKDGTGPDGKGPKKTNQGTPRRDGSGSGKGRGRGPGRNR